MSDAKVDIDYLAPQKSHIKLDDHQLPTDFGINDYKLTKLYGDAILLEYADLVGDESEGDFIERNGIVIPVSQVKNAWRKGRVVLKGKLAKDTEVGDIVMFPNNMGIPITNVDIHDYGRVKNGIFLNEERLFGGCLPIGE